jgi:hypothetical protein
MSKSRVLVALVAALLVITALASCSDDDDGGRAGVARPGSEIEGPDAAVVGFAHAGGPLVGATVQIVDADGKELATAVEPTLPSGSWAVELDEMPSAFSVVVTGGKDDTGPFDGTLKAEVPEHEPWTAIHVNLVTTIVSGVLADDPKLDVDEAETRVRTTLGLPMSNDLRSDLRLRAETFSGRMFMQEAADGDGTSALLDEVEQDVAAGKVHRFTPPASNDLVSEDVLSAFAGKIGNSVVSAGGAALVGYALNSIGYGNASMQSVLALQREVDGVSTQLSLVEDQLTAIQVQLDVTQYTTAVDTLSGTQSVIQGAQADLDTVFGSFQASDVGTVPAPRKTLGLSIAAFKSYVGNESNNGILQKALVQINDEMVSEGGSNGGLEAWHDAVIAQSPRFVTHDVQERFDVAFQFWAGYQLRTVDINLEYESYMNGAIDTCTKGTAASPKGAKVFMFQGNALCEYASWGTGPIQQEHSAAQTAGLDDVPTKAAGLFDGIADRATGLVWVRDRVSTELGAPDTTDAGNTDTSKCIYQGSPNCQYADALTAIAAMNQTSAATKGGWKFRLPTNAEVVNLVSTVGTYAGWVGLPSPGDFLTSNAGCPQETTIDSVTNAVVDAPIDCMFAANITGSTRDSNGVWDSDADLTTYVTVEKYAINPTPQVIPGLTYRNLLNLATSGPTNMCTNDNCAYTVNHPDSSVDASPTLADAGGILFLVAERPSTELKYWPQDTGALAGS